MATLTPGFPITWHNVRRDEEGDPRDDDEQPGGEVVGDDVGHHVATEVLPGRTREEEEEEEEVSVHSMRTQPMSLAWIQ